MRGIVRSFFCGFFSATLLVAGGLYYLQYLPRQPIPNITLQDTELAVNPLVVARSLKSQTTPTKTPSIPTDNGEIIEGINDFRSVNLIGLNGQCYSEVVTKDARLRILESDHFRKGSEGTGVDAKEDVLFRYSLQPNVDVSCQTSQLIIYVKSAMREFQPRQVVRETWGVVAKQEKIPVIFSVGSPTGKEEKEENLTDKLRSEQQKYGDLLQADFVDVYDTMPLKTLATLHWHVHSCAKNRSNLFVFSTDTDVIVFPENILNLTKRQKPGQKTITGACWQGARANRNASDSKNFVSLRLWPASSYPHYCSGSGFLMAPSVPRTLLDNIPAKSARARKAWIASFEHLNDILFTGILSAGTQIQIKNTGDVYFQPYPLEKKKGKSGLPVRKCDKGFLSAHNYKPAEHMRQMWEKLREKLKHC